MRGLVLLLARGAVGWAPLSRGLVSLSLTLLRDATSSSVSAPELTLPLVSDWSALTSIATLPAPAVAPSAHLLLSEVKDTSDDKSSRAAALKLFEYVYGETTLMASMSATSLPLTLFGRSMQLNASVSIRETAQPTSQRILELWESERLLSQSKDPLEYLLNGAGKDFNATLGGHVRRMEVLFQDLRQQEAVAAFLSQQVAPSTNQSLALLRWDPSLSESVMLDNLKHIAEWFRGEFPYYYDTCLQCTNKVNNTFIGYIRPNEDETRSRAGRTELYSCGKCGGLTRFPRFNLLDRVLLTRRGRCGEYSMLAYRCLALLGYSVRWVVDWADHVWVEVRGDDRWVTLDPCEAAVDEPLLYESWGKNQTFIMAMSFSEGVEDVTARYTSDVAAALARRDESDEVVSGAIDHWSLYLRSVLAKNDPPLSSESTAVAPA